MLKGNVAVEANLGDFSKKWVQEQTARLGRPPRVLHVGNVASNGYVNASILSELGIENHVAANDLYHFGSCPEWFYTGGAGIDRSKLGDDFFPNFWAAGVPDDFRPRWFAQGTQFVTLEYLCHLCDGNPLKNLAWDAMQYERFRTSYCLTTAPQNFWQSDSEFEAAALESRLPDDVRRSFEGIRAYRPLLERAYKAGEILYGETFRNAVSLPLPPGYIDGFEPYSDDKELFVEWRRLRKAGELSAIGYEMAELPARTPTILPKQLRAEDAAPYALVGQYWEKLFSRYDYVVNYATQPILGIINRRRYLAYEHGTIRSIPFDDDPTGRMTYAGYKYAGGVFITNIDYVTAKKRMEFDRKKIHYIPHGFDEFHILKFLENNQDLKPPSDVVTFFWPTRQDWTSRDARMAKQNDVAIQAAALAAAQTTKPFRIVAVDWGVDKEESKLLVKQLGIEAHFDWVVPLNKSELWRRYRQSHCIIDQFIGSSVNGTTCEAMMLARPVMCFDDGICAKVAYGECPPYLNGATAEDLAVQFLAVINDPNDTAGLGKAGFDWMMHHHSKAVITDIFVRALDATPNGVFRETLFEVVGHAAKTVPGKVVRKLQSVARAAKTTISAKAHAAQWHLKNQIGIAAWHSRDIAVKVQGRTNVAAWHVKNQIGVTAWHSRALAAKVQGRTTVAIWHVKNQAHIAAWHARGFSTNVKNNANLASWHVKNQAGIAAWHVRSLGANVKNNANVASWHIKNQAHIAAWHARGFSTNVKNNANLASWHVKNQAGITAWHVRSLGAKVKNNADVASWHVKNQAHIAAWHARGFSAKVKNNADVASWHVKNQAHIAAWHARGFSADVKNNANLASWHVKNQAGVAAWHVRSLGTNVKNNVDLASWHVKNQAGVAAWHAGNLGANVKNNADLASWHVKNQADQIALSAKSVAIKIVNNKEVQAELVVNDRAEVNISGFKLPVASIQSEPNSRVDRVSHAGDRRQDASLVFSSPFELSGSLEPLTEGRQALVTGEKENVDSQAPPPYYFDVEDPAAEPSPTISWGEIFKIFFSLNFLVFLFVVLRRRFLRTIGVLPKTTVLKFGKEAEDLIFAREPAVGDHDWRFVLINGQSAILKLFEQSDEDKIGVRARFGALVPGGEYVVYWDELSASWFGIGPNSDMLDEQGRCITASARSIGPSGPASATINVWGVVFRFGPDGSVRHNGDTVGWLLGVTANEGVA